MWGHECEVLEYSIFPLSSTNVGVLIATQHNPVILAFNQKLEGARKPKTVAIVASMRKLFATINTMLKIETTLAPKTTAISAWNQGSCCLQCCSESWPLYFYLVRTHVRSSKLSKISAHSPWPPKQATEKCTNFDCVVARSIDARLGSHTMVSVNLSTDSISVRTKQLSFAFLAHLPITSSKLLSSCKSPWSQKNIQWNISQSQNAGHICRSHQIENSFETSANKV